MKVLFLNTADISGGAALAAMRVADELEKMYNTKNLFIVSEKFSNMKHVIQSRNKLTWFFEKSFNKIAQYFGVQYTYIPISSSKILEIANNFEPDIINLHNVHGGYIDFATLEKLALIAPIVWTLHDCWAFTGHCAYPFDCEKWKQKCDNCPSPDSYPPLYMNGAKDNFKKKQKLLKKITPFLILPSQWLSSEISKSPIVHNLEKEVVLNGIDTDPLFYPVKHSKKLIGVEENVSTILFAAANLDDKRKGSDMITSILDIVDKNSKSKINVLLLGNVGKIEFPVWENISIHFTGYINQDKMKDYYSAADLYILPTQSDNLPLTVIESIACGTPVVAFDVGGISEIVEKNINGLLITPFDVEELSKNILELLHDKELLKNMSKNGRDIAVELFTVEDMAEKYFSIFKKAANL